MKAVVDGVTGANEKDFHLTGINFTLLLPNAKWADLRSAGSGDTCARCGGTYKAYKGIEGGHIFVLGTHYSAKMKATFLDDKGVEKPIVMGCYGIGVSRVVAAAIEQHHDADGIVWPIAIAPFEVLVTPLGTGAEVAKAAGELHDRLAAAGIDVLLDDREERPGVKFKDADLLGIPLRVTIGERGLKEGIVELKRRTEKDPAKIPLAEAEAAVVQAVRAARA